MHLDVEGFGGRIWCWVAGEVVAAGGCFLSLSRCPIVNKVNKELIADDRKGAPMQDQISIMRNKIPRAF
jgi:hypothetical protein